MKRFQVERKKMCGNRQNESTIYNFKSYLIVFVAVFGIISISSFNISFADSTVTSVSTDSSPTSIAHTSNYTYVTNFGSNTVSVIDASNNVISSISVGTQPYGAAYNSYNGKIYVTNFGSNTISVIDPATNTATSTIPGLSILGLVLPSFTNPSGVIYDSANHNIYVANYGSNTISVIDSTSGGAIATITVGAQPYGMSYNSDNGKIYVCNYGSSTISVIDPATNTVISTISGLTGPGGLTYDSANHNIYVANSDSNTVSVIDPSSNSVINTISVGSGPIGMAYSTSTNNVYVSNFNSNTVSVIDGNSNSVTSTISVGQYPYGASYDSYNGNIYVANYGSNTVSVITPPPTPAPTPIPALKLSTTTVLISSANPSVLGQSVTFTANVASSSGTPTGTVNFMDGTSTLGSCTLSSNSCTLSSSSLLLGTHSITASYSGDSNFNPSTSALLTQTVKKLSTTITVTSNANPSVTGQSITFTAVASAVSPGSGTPTGTVNFMDGTSTLGSCTLSSNSCTLSSSSLLLGTHSITASYSGDSNFNPSTSALLTQTVKKLSTTITVTSNANPSLLGQYVTYLAVVSAGSQGFGTPTGAVTFYDGSTIIGTGILNGGLVMFSTSLNSAGSHSITASYSGDYNFDKSTSPVLAQVAQYKFNGFLTPVNGETDGIGSTVQIKFPLYDAYNNLVTTATGSVFVDGNPATPNGSLIGILGNILSFSGSGNYKFGLSTNGLAVGPHTISVTLNDGSVHSVLINLR